MKIFLNFIMKNESHILNRMLTSVLPLIDGCVCVDTGSTDNSKEIVKAFFEEKGLPCEIYDHPFINFENARNYALEKVKSKCDIGFWMDCDEQLIVPPNFNINEFKNRIEGFDRISATVQYGPQKYGRSCFFRTSKAFKWIGAVHEVLVCSEPVAYMNMPEITILVTPDGNSWSSPEKIKEKYLDHARILKKEVEKNNSPRDIFYLAQSYKDAGEKKKSLFWYQRRALRDDGFYEERYYAQYMAGNLSNELGRPSEQVIFEFIKAHELDSFRGEHILNLIVYLQSKNMWETAYLFSEYAVNHYHNKNPYNNTGSSQRVLFIDEATYSHRILESHRLNCQRTNRPEYFNKNHIENISFDDLLDTIPSAWKGHGKFAEWLVNKINPKVIVELGVDYGYSLFCLARANKGKVYGLDSFKGDPLTGIRNTYSLVNNYIDVLKNKHDINNIELITGQFDDLISMPFGSIDILHIDGSPKEVENDYNKWLPLLSENGVILFHDTQSFEEVKNLFNSIPLYKIEFTNSGGLGIASRNKDIIESIKNWNTPTFEIEPITIGYISHNNDVFNKYLKPSIDNLIGSYKIISTSDELKPAENYNKIIDSSETKYILLIHEDVTFGSDFLINIHNTIKAYPNFGAIGAVGTDINGKYEWSEIERIKEIQKLDCCCILINKDHKIKFDSETFNNFHLYVEDYCLQAISKGLKCYTILTNASEAEKGVGYINSNSYFRHHSFTVNQRGYCWGRYYEYLEKLKNKWIAPIGPNDPTGIADFHEVDICIISYAKNDELEQITNNGIQTLLESESNIKFNIFVIESNKDVNYHYPNTTTIYPDTSFGYHKYLNIAIKQGNAPYVVLCNSDLTYEKGWASEIIKQMTLNPLILSASPLCPQLQKKEYYPWPFVYGNRVRQELAGWCIFVQRKVFDIIGPLDERFIFWYCDNDYAMELHKHNITHALICGSIVNHHENRLGATSESVLDAEEKKRLTNDQEIIFKKKWGIPL